MPGNDDRPAERDLSVMRLPRCASFATAAALLSIAMPEARIAANPQPLSVVSVQPRPRAGAAAAAAVAAKPEAKSEPSGPPPPKNLEPLPPGAYTGVLGKEVQSLASEKLGPIVDVIVNVDGTPRAAVIDFGGFLGVGSRKIAVDWRLLNFAPDQPDDRIWLSLNRAEIQAAPEYKPDAPMNEMVGPPWEAPSLPAAGPAAGK
jgi:PRC-barrel domain